MKDLVSRERAVTLEILMHLIEVERRRLHLGLGYPSMFEYAIRHLGYSASAAARRIRAARCIRDHPEVYGLLEENELTLITVSLVGPILDESNAQYLIGKIRGKSQREVEAIVATYRPPVSMQDRAKPVCVAVATLATPQLNGLPGDLTASADSEKRPKAAADAVGTRAASSAGGPLQAGAMTQSPLQPSTRSSCDHPTPPPRRLEQKFHVQFLASERFMQKFERAKSLLSNKKGALSYEAVLEAALDEFLKDHDPEQRNQRREERREKAEARTKSGKRVGSGGASRGIPAAIRDAVFVRDKGQCTYVGSNGARCEATQHLQVDHIIPYARGGTNAFHNLRLLCERHNKREAERILGANAIRRFCRRE